MQIRLFTFKVFLWEEEGHPRTPAGLVGKFFYGKWDNSGVRKKEYDSSVNCSGALNWGRSLHSNEIIVFFCSAVAHPSQEFRLFERNVLPPPENTQGFSHRKQKVVECSEAAKELE